jgi:elongation factor P hydroxylase
MNHNPDDLITLFNGLFRETCETILVRGNGEPEYRPARGPHSPAQVVFAHGYYASALHEISHWCIAGKQRRTLHDYGYWYCPDGRTHEQQQAFEQVEIRPQALEWLFSLAAGSRFHISVDNLSGSGPANEHGFRRNVRAQADRFLISGLPGRAGQFFEALKRFYGTGSGFTEAWRRDSLRIAPLSSELNTLRKTETV